MLEVPDFPVHMVGIYASCVRLEAELAVRSFNASYRAYERNAGADQISGLLHDALNHCASLSRYFWPAPSKNRSMRSFAVARGSALRDSFFVDDESPLSDRNLRNSLEHFDERLDDWVLTGPVGPVIATPIVAEFAMAESEVGHVFKLIDPESDTAVLLGKTYKFDELSREVCRIALGLRSREELDD